MTVNDVSPHYLPDGRIVFSTTRQRQSQGMLLNEGKPEFIAPGRGAHRAGLRCCEVMSADGTSIHQISFNQSHDRDATVLANGRMLWTRWDNTPRQGPDGSLYRPIPDGTDLELYYGANSHMTGTNDSVIEFSHPHEMQDGDILVIARQYTDVDFGGELGDHRRQRSTWRTRSRCSRTPALTGPAQTPATHEPGDARIPGPSPGGRFNSA